MTRPDTHTEHGAAELRGDYWDIIETALTSLPETSRLRAPALASFDHLKERVIENHRAALAAARGKGEA